MKFSDNLAAQLTPEWRCKYIEYEELKKLIYMIESKSVCKSNSVFSESEENRNKETIAQMSEDFLEETRRQLKYVLEFYKSQESQIIDKFSCLKRELDLFEKANDQGLKLLKGLPKRRNDLRFAFREFYLNLIILQNFREMNYTGFRKILKKFDKVVRTTDGKRFMDDQVKHSELYSSRKLEELINETEQIVIQRIEEGNRKIAMNGLRVPPLRDNSQSVNIFFSGIFFGALVISLVVLLISFFFVQRDYVLQEWKFAYSAFRPTFLISLTFILLSVNTKGWVKYGVNHVLIFQYDPRDHLSVAQLFQVGSFCMLTWSVFSIFYLYSHPLGVHFMVAPTLLLITFATFLFFPLPVFYYKSRRWLLIRLVRVFLAPFFPVEFADFWLGDILNSLVTVFLDLEFFSCSLILFILEYTFGYSYGIICGTVTYGVRPIVACLPSWFRFIQCVRRYFTTNKSYPHLLNAGKYFCSFLVIAMSTINATTKNYYSENTSAYFVTLAAWIIASIINTVYTLSWDLLMDWGLFTRVCKFRTNRVYPHLIYYIIAAIENAVLRALWTLSLSIGQLALFPLEYIAFPLAGLEVFRRFVWNFFRLENEHLNNCGEFRVVRDISLKPLVFTDEK